MEPSKENIDSVLKSSIQKIQFGDRLSVVMATKDPSENEILNPLGIVRGGGGTGGSNTVIGYQVAKDSTIELPVLGFVKVGGLTIAGAAEVIKKRLSVTYKEPYVNVNLLGRVVVMGTRSPGVVPLFNERLTIFEAIAQSGEMEPSARRDRVWVIREQDGERTSALINLNSPDVFSSPYYYLRTNDLIYVEPNRLGSFLGVNAPGRTLFAVTTGIFSIIITFLLLNL
ncbi:MAG: polysaccharide biosynthesis/export family protein [Chitinophagaceae bacterium]|nr:polysaccharide biosynthesis/export family protein [Chitinophagaceae bacterium]